MRYAFHHQCKLPNRLALALVYNQLVCHRYNNGQKFIAETGDFLAVPLTKIFHYCRCCEMRKGRTFALREHIFQRRLRQGDGRKIIIGSNSKPIIFYPQLALFSCARGAIGFNLLLALFSAIGFILRNWL